MAGWSCRDEGDEGSKPEAGYDINAFICLIGLDCKASKIWKSKNFNNRIN